MADRNHLRWCLLPNHLNGTGNSYRRIRRGYSSTEELVAQAENCRIAAVGGFVCVSLRGQQRCLRADDTPAG